MGIRSIEFRGRTEKGKWIYGVPFEDYDGNMLVGNYGSKVKVIPETIGQYTGLTDKNGTKIFENDIVVLKGNEEEPFTVEFAECCFQIYGDGVCYCMDNFYDHDLEVIGNVFDNPELLKDGETK